MLTLFYSPGACSLAIHIALLEQGIEFGLKKVDLKTKKLEDESNFQSINPKGYVPTIQLENREVLTENAAILTYIAAQGSSQIQPPGTFGPYRLLEWLTFVSSELHKSLGIFFNQNLPEEFKVKLRDKIEKRFNVLENRLNVSQFLVSNNYSVADAYCFAILNWLPILDTGLKIEKWPKLCEYITKMRSRPKVMEALKAEGILK
jgi:glutathione S-transferase